MTIFTVITLLGGLAMFLYGMEIMSAGLKNASGTALKRVLEKVASNAFMGVLTGALVTAVIQSSTATIVITVGLITAGVLNLKQAVCIVLGANIGTTITAQIIRLMDVDSSGNFILQFFNASTLAPLAMIIGIILIMFIKKNNTKTVGEIFVGFGVLFTGLMSMTSSVEPLAESEAFANIISGFTDMPIVGILTGLVLTMIVQSSSAMVGMLQALSVTGVMTMNLVYPIIMGINLGTCVTTAMVCSIGSSKDAKRTGIAHIVFNVIGTILFMVIMTLLKVCGVFPDMWGKIVDSGDIANFQTVFNLVTAVVLLPFTNVLVKITYLIVKPDSKKEEVKDDYSAALTALDDKLYVVPHIAISEAKNVIGIMGTIARSNFSDSISQLQNYSEEISVGIDTREEKLDSITDTVENFLVDLSKNIQSDEQNEIVNIMIQTSTDFERIGDYATNINEFAQEINSEKLSFSPIAIKELSTILKAVDDIIDLTVKAFLEDDIELAKRVEPFEEVIDDMVQYLRDSHINRLKTGQCTIQAGILFIETLTYLERASDQCSSIAMLLISRFDPQIRKNHHEYIEQLHRSPDSLYGEEIKKRREEFLVPLHNIKKEMQ
ncbi:MAG: Na/Pi cotransporter family protein [Eubacteriales bacterium]